MFLKNMHENIEKNIEIIESFVGILILLLFMLANIVFCIDKIIFLKMILYMCIRQFVIYYLEMH